MLGGWCSATGSVWVCRNEGQAECGAFTVSACRRVQCRRAAGTLRAGVRSARWRQLHSRAGKRRALISVPMQVWACLANSGRAVPQAVHCIQRSAGKPALLLYHAIIPSDRLGGRPRNLAPSCEPGTEAACQVGGVLHRRYP